MIYKCVKCNKKITVELNKKTTCCKNEYELTDDNFIIIKNTQTKPEFATAERVK